MLQRVARQRGPTVAGVPLRVSTTFAAVAILIGWHAGRDVASTPFVDLPEDLRDVRESLTPGDPLLGTTVSHPSIGWVLAAGLGAALVYFLSVLAHELGHLTVARAVGVDVSAIELGFAGGFVEMHDDDRLTAGRLAAIVGAGPLVTAVLALASWLTLEALGLNLLPFRPLDGGQLLVAARLRLRRQGW
jgi:Zn-dependent protease